MLARRHQIDPRRGSDKLLPRLEDNARILRVVYDTVTASITPGQPIDPAEAWLLDNFYLIEQQVVQVRRYLPQGYSRELPRLLGGPAAGFPRIYDLALELILHMDGRVDRENATHFIACYQSIEPLKLGELWAFPIMLQLALLENLRNVVLRIKRRREERETAIAWADRMLETVETSPKNLIQLLAEFAHADVPLTAPFVEEFYARLQAQGPAMAFVQTWVEHKLFEQGVTATQLSEVAARRAAANRISIANSIGSLHFIEGMDWRNYVEALSAVEQTLSEDPAEVYALQDFATRDRYRHVIEDVAKNCDCKELAVAREAVALAQAAAESLTCADRRAHVGYYLVDRGRLLLERSVGCRASWRSRLRNMGPHARLVCYLGPIALLTAVATWLALLPFGGFAASDWRFWFFLLMAMLGGSAPAVALTNLLATLSVGPRALPRLDFARGIPPVHRTMAVVPTLINTLREIDELLAALEIRYLGNRDPNLFFALLTDFRDAAESALPGDEALLAHARAGVEALNASYRDDRPCIFYLLHRPRLWNPHERVWMGYERKRGKLEQFNALLRGEDKGAFSRIVGDRSIFPSIRYVITLDTDTQLPRDSAHMLIGNLAHPLNRPLYDSATGRVVEGYAILQPRASISLTSAASSRFSALYAGESGIDPYTRQVSDVYQDIFGEGSFVGKGIYDVDAFHRALNGRFPENLILSHDLLESGYARSALVSDVELVEEHPSSYAVESSRRHRWIRGDWQLIHWLMPRVPGPGQDGARAKNPLTALSRWKLLDNLRRSLVPPSLLALVLGGWLWAPSVAWFWVLLVAGLVLLPVLLRIALDVLRKPRGFGWLGHLILTAKSAVHSLTLALLSLVLLPYDALICLRAILFAGLRMPFTRRGLLLWHPRSYAKRNRCRTPLDFFREMWIAPVLALVPLLVPGMDAQTPAWIFSASVMLLWIASPAVAWWISRPLEPAAPELDAEQRIFLRTAARRTWRYFADFVGPEDNWLPPDNFQEHPQEALATRTSPTNIGLSLLSQLAAHDFGYLCTGELLRLIGNTLTTMEKLERYRGHFYNWYDTRTLEPLRPHYISSVDSGNLVGSLLTLQAGLLELKQQPLLTARTFAGLWDTAQVLAEQLPASIDPRLQQQLRSLQDMLTAFAVPAAHPPGLAAVVGRLTEARRAVTELQALLPADTAAEPTYWAQALDRQLRAVLDDCAQLSPQAERFTGVPTLEAASPHSAAALERLHLLDDLAERCRRLALQDFEFLYDGTRHLLTIGYDAGERRRDPSCYDLLASEARLASFLLIAQGQAPQKHWFALGRLLTRHGGNVSLISWSGSMFEYLMPRLIMPGYDNTLLEESCRAAVLRQIEYGRQRAVPWGISESCYNLSDRNQIYQYRAFGVPGLGFKRGLGEDLVIAPYASALALTILPQAACRNLQLLADSGFRGRYGFYEAIDYTPSRVPRGREHVVVRTFMAHHHGMSLLSFGHVLFERPMQRRFMANPLVRATIPLLQERLPKVGATLQLHAAEVNAAAPPASTAADTIMRVFTNPQTRVPEVQLLSNGRYHLMATHAGGGYSRWRDLAVSRWREDATRDCWGTFIYLRDLDTGRYWSSAHQPTLRKAEHYEAIFLQARAEYRRRDQELETHTEIIVSPEDDVEIRRLTLSNLSPRNRHIELTSYAEVVLAPLNADRSHRSFSNLFVQTEILAWPPAILCTRRRRTPGERTPWMFHLFAAPGTAAGEPSYETDRARFIGRGRTPVNPAALEDAPSPLSNTQGSVLDPIVAIRRGIPLPGDESVVVQFISGMADTREAAVALIEKYSDRHFIDRAFEMTWFQSQQVLRQLNVGEADAQLYSRLAGSVVYGNALRRATPGVIARNRQGQSGLWRFAVSGDLPIVLLHVGDLSRIELVKQVLQAHAYWRVKGLQADLVIINEDFSGYRAVLHDRIIGLINARPEAALLDRPGGVFVRRAEELSEQDRVLFQTVACIVLTDTGETLYEQLERRLPAERMPERLVPSLEAPAEERAPPQPERKRIFDNGLGGFSPAGDEYIITLEPGQNTPAPWANVIASPHIGTVVSERGGAYTWTENAHEYRLTPWHNDPLTDASGEAFYIRDEETGAFWSPTPSPACGRTAYVCRHGFGYSVFEHHEAGISSELRTYVAMDAPVKFAVIKLHNHSRRGRRLSLTGYWELVLGEWRHVNLMHIITEIEPYSGALLARNAFSRGFANRIFFAQVSEEERTVSGNRAEFIGRNRSLAAPAALRRAHLSGKTGAALDPCAAIQSYVELGPGEEREIAFIFGAARGRDEAQTLVRRFGRLDGARQALEAVEEFWGRTLGAVRVETPDPALNVLANGWLVYQTLSCRFWGRSGYYQSGGAYGFRDQLQDSLALIHTTPWVVREQLIRCAERQFLRGDVQHWWHPPGGHGVRTHFSDDYLWLPYVASQYVRATGDTGVLDEPVHFLEGRELNPEEESYYDQPQRSAEVASLYEHCARAIRHGLRFGPHQLPLMGCGDWNDGMNLVGSHGRGESVWLAWFLYDNLKRFAELARSRGDTAFSTLCAAQATSLHDNIETHAWDGEWYLRAWFDDGTPLGSKANAECRIDSLSQSWAVISGGGDAERTAKAMAAVDAHLVSRDTRLVRLFSPPFDKSNLEPGYIKGYVPGVRENGGQYTHAAIWTAMAFALLGDNEKAWELCNMLNPINRGARPADVERYKVEPYVMCADIYAAPPHTGRGGWSWYTGAAGWMYRLILETLLGLQLDVNHLRIAPCMPAHWPGYKIDYRYRSTRYHIAVRRSGTTTPTSIRVLLDGRVIDEANTEGGASRLEGIITLIDDRREHTVEVELS
jgi:cyclic beta-1,2-glucan synthetase